MTLPNLIAGLLSGTFAGMGLGGGAVLIIYLSWFTDNPQLNNQGINLLFFIPIGLFAVIMYSLKKKIKWSKVLPLALTAIPGICAGVFISQILSDTVISKIFAVLLIIFGIFQIISPSHLIYCLKNVILKKE